MLNPVYSYRIYAIYFYDMHGTFRVFLNDVRLVDALGVDLELGSTGVATTVIFDPVANGKRCVNSKDEPKMYFRYAFALPPHVQWGLNPILLRRYFICNHNSK